MTQIFPGSMKKIISILGVISLFAACTAELDTTPEITEEQAPIIEKTPVLYASIEEGAETKVYLDENYKVLWHADDRISVFNKDTYNLQYRFDGNTGDNSGTFSEVPDGLLHTSNAIENLYAVYPYSASTSISNTSVLTVNYPAAQTYSAGSFGLGANTMVAVTDANNLQFKNACGYLMFKLYGTNVKVKTVSLKGNNHEKIAGEATITMSLGGDPIVAMSGSATEEIILTCAESVSIGSTSENYTEFWFTLPPVTFENGFTVTITDNCGGSFSKSTSSSLEITRSYARKMAPIEVIPLIPDYVDMGLSVKWGTCNLGASTPTETGGFYAWGEVYAYNELHPDNALVLTGTPKTYYSSGYYKYSDTSNPYGGYTKYNDTDNLTTLESSDDAASFVLGGNWRMPTRAEAAELIDNSTLEYTIANGVKGALLTSNKTGYTTKSIFIPMAGLRRRDQYYHTGFEEGVYSWTSSIGYDSYNEYFGELYLNVHGSIFLESDHRYYGMTIRPVITSD